ncbi:helix-turn-helix domain-containing protein [Streptomyces sp. NBC_00057]|uniref:helix-turn-helix domain-containing protein n=1 Tax=Streptomyces sp. NBC_00057 TaxID=2975634 RepID=UPI0038632D96
MASALSHLQRRGGYTLRRLASDIGVHPSYISRILNGERDPSWCITAGLAVACAADPADLLPLWNTVHNVATPLPATPAEAADRYRAFLRGLRLSAAAPTPHAICEASDNTLTPTDVTRALEGPGIPDWPTTCHLVLVLRGRPADLHPIWRTASTPPAARVTTISAGAFG